jgi:4-amino-4-deoxy-L-arabinose transferase-like glycosyltransferase
VTTVSDAPLRKPGSEEQAPQPAVSRPLLAAGIAIGAAGLVFFFYTRSAMWLDEALTVNIARLPLSQLHAALKQDGAPPLFYVLLHFWTALFGTGNVAVRSLSGLFMTGTVVATWFAARRFAGTKSAWIAAALTFASPYAIRYATEARMYSLEMLLVASGIVAFQRAMEKPSLGRLAVISVLVALFVYNQYWAFYLLVTVVALFAWLAWRGPERDASRRVLVAISAGLLFFLPWAPTFLYQRAHTGTPWGLPVLPGIPFGYTLRDFAGGASGASADRQEGWILLFVLLPMLLLGIFGRPVDDRHIDIDVHIPRETRAIAFVGLVGLVVALTLDYLAGGAFQTRYSAIVFPFFILLVARGFTMLTDTRILAAVLGVAILLGFYGGYRNLTTQRTQAPDVAAVLRKDAKPGDVVVYCPDQVGPAVNRLAPSGLDQFVYPSFAGPERIDWVDYKKRLAQADIGAFARTTLERARGHTLWYVSAPGYLTHVGTCEALSNEFANKRERVQRTVSDPNVFEKPALQMFPAHAGG